MLCHRISYRDFRCIESATLEFSPGVNLFIGDNAQGKTSALEGIFLFARGKSFRTSHDAEMVRFGAEAASVTMSCTAGKRSYDMRVAYSKDGRRICRRNDIDVKRLSEFVGYFRAVLFCPAHLGIVQDGPGVRRAFIDAAISQIKPAYLSALQRYSGILAQRNTLIKNRFNDPASFEATIEHWSAQLAREGAVISKERAEYIARLSGHANLILSDMTCGQEHTELIYRDLKSEAELFSELCSSLERECRYGATLYGPHKDDIEIRLCDRPARSFASQGQQRSIALAMKLGEGEISRELTGEAPVLALDDVLSELDTRRREYVTGGFSGRQVFLTACGDLPEPVLSESARFVISQGKIERTV